MGRRLMSRGFGPSKQTPVAPPESFPPNPDDGLPPRQYWTIAGKPVAGHPEEHRITYDMTDQAIAARVQRQQADPFHGAGLVADSQDKLKVARMRTFEETGDPQASAQYDLKKVLADKHRDPAKVQMYAPEKECDQYTQGGGFETVFDRDGKPVKFKDQVLLQKPRDVQQREHAREEQMARTHLRDKAQEQIEAMRTLARENNIPQSSINSVDFGLSEDFV